jgi:alpha-1,6-mannosyltransferase
MFYGPTGGGIRTYHNAKIDWFASQERYHYLLVHPGPREVVDRPARTVTIVSLPGVRARGDYRLPLSFHRLYAVIRDAHPDVLEAGDPWFSGPLGLLFKRWRHVGLLASFFHGDPIRTYVEPWVARGRALTRARRQLGARADRYFFRVQQLYDLTVTSSPEVETMLRRRGVHRILRVPFGIDPLFLQVGLTRSARGRRSRLLYVGRLQDDKGIDVLVAAVPILLALGDYEITIVGTGPMAPAVSRLASPRVHVRGFVSSRDELAQLYAEHDVLLAPGPYETFGITALEALASGLSVVGPDQGGTGALLRGLDAPHLFSAGDVAGFVRAVSDATVADARTEAQSGRRVVQRYGSWADAIGCQVDSYCRHLSLSTT